MQPPEVQSRKEFHDKHSSLPGKPRIDAHTAEILRQVAGAGVPEVGGLAVMRGFGNVITSVETMIRLKVHSTFIVKNNQTMYPMQALHSTCGS